jgi:hypothetical protein
MNQHNSKSDEDITAMRWYYGQMAPPDPATLTAVRRDVLTRIVASSPSVGLKRRRGLVLTTGIAGLAAVVIGVTSTQQGAIKQPARGVTNYDSLSAPATLNLAANESIGDTPLVIGKQGYVYTRTRTESVSKTGRPGDNRILWFYSDTIEETWASQDGLAPLRIVRTTGLDAHPLIAADATALQAADPGWRTTNTTSSDLGDTTSGKPSLDSPTPAYLDSLPTEPTQLLNALNAATPYGKADPAGESAHMFETVSELVTKADALLSPKLRAALYGVLATLPGVERIPGEVDLAGRSGIAVSHTDDGVRTDLILDPTTARVIGMRTVFTSTAADSILPAGTVLEWSTADQKIVTKVGAKS